MTATRRAGLDFISHSSLQTKELGAALARKLQPGDLILLSGVLGSGKTTFIQGIASGLDIQDNVTSPTFTLVSNYEGHIATGPVTFHHIDLYRLAENSDDLYTFGLDELLEDEQAICAIEWPQRAPELLPDNWLLIELQPIAETKRRARFIGNGQRHKTLVDELREEVSGARG